MRIKKRIRIKKLIRIKKCLTRIKNHTVTSTFLFVISVITTIRPVKRLCASTRQHALCDSCVLHARHRFRDTFCTEPNLCHHGPICMHSMPQRLGSQTLLED